MKSLLLSLLISFSSVFPSITQDVSSIIPGGESIGVEIKPHGVVVIGGYDVISEDIKYNPLKDSDIKKGDLIYQVNDEDIDSIEDLLEEVKDNINEDSVRLSIIRNDKKISREIKFVKTSSANTMKTGLLVKERILGIGTVTFYDPETKIYGALGHKLMDQDFSTVTDINSGTIYTSLVNGVNKSSKGNVGEILATIYEDESLGNVFANTDYGVFGYYNRCPDKDALEVASHDEIKLGKAQIYTTLKDDNVESYDIEITSLQKQNVMSTKGITFKITDEDLLNKTGGIVQGMSGSPIIQDGKIVGAVTHVLVDSVKKGYGLYIDFMIEASKIGL